MSLSFLILSKAIFGLVFYLLKIILFDATVTKPATEVLEPR